MHMHKPLLCASEPSTKQRGEKGPYLSEPPPHKERGINTTFLFFSFTTPSPLYTPLTPDRPIVGRDKGLEKERGKWGSKVGVCVCGGGEDSPDKRMNDPFTVA